MITGSCLLCAPLIAGRSALFAYSCLIARRHLLPVSILVSELMTLRAMVGSPPGPAPAAGSSAAGQVPLVPAHSADSQGAPVGARDNLGRLGVEGVSVLAVGPFPWMRSLLRDIALCVKKMFARLAGSRAASEQSGRVNSELVTTLTVGLGLVPCREVVGDQAVLSGRHWLKVGRVDTQSIPADMVQVGCTDETATCHLVSIAMGKEVAFIYPKDAIPFGGATQPVPATIRTNGHLRHEPAVVLRDSLQQESQRSGKPVACHGLPTRPLLMIQLPANGAGPLLIARLYVGVLRRSGMSVLTAVLILRSQPVPVGQFHVQSRGKGNEMVGVTAPLAPALMMDVIAGGNGADEQFVGNTMAEEAFPIDRKSAVSARTTSLPYPAAVSVFLHSRKEPIFPFLHKPMIRLPAQGLLN